MQSTVHIPDRTRHAGAARILAGRATDGFLSAVAAQWVRVFGAALGMRRPAIRAR